MLSHLVVIVILVWLLANHKWQDSLKSIGSIQILSQGLYHWKFLDFGSNSNGYLRQWNLPSLLWRNYLMQLVLSSESSLINILQVISAQGGPDTLDISPDTPSMVGFSGYLFGYSGCISVLTHGSSVNSEVPSSLTRKFRIYVGKISPLQILMDLDLDQVPK